MVDWLLEQFDGGFLFVWTTSSPYLFTVIPFTIHNTHWQTYENNNIKRPHFQKWIFHALPFEPRLRIHVHARKYTHTNWRVVRLKHCVRCSSLRCYAPRTLSLSLRFAELLPHEFHLPEKTQTMQSTFRTTSWFRSNFEQYIGSKTWSW